MRFYAATFATAFMELEMLQGDALFDPDETPPAEGAWRTTAAQRLIIMADECNRVGFDRLRERCKRLAQNVKTVDVLIAYHMLRDLLPDIQSEMARHMYFFVPEHRKCWYHDDNQPLFVKELEQQPKGSTKDTELQYYGETTAHFRSVKEAWRNHVSHARTTYDEREATSILNHVREFMDLLAGRPHS